MNNFKELTSKQITLGVICLVVLIAISFAVLVSTTQPKEIKVESVHDISEMPVVVEPIAEELPAATEAAMEQIQEPEPEPVVEEYVEPEPQPLRL